MCSLSWLVLPRGHAQLKRLQHPVCTTQVALEDSLVTMSTILSSRFVGGIRTEVEKVERQLNLFADTLDQWVQVGQ